MKFIFEVRVKPGYTVEEYAESWVRASEVIQQTPGARGTRLHRKIGEPDVLLAIACWESKVRGMPRMTCETKQSAPSWKSTLNSVNSS